MDQRMEPIWIPLCIHTHSLCIATVVSPECIKSSKCISVRKVKRNSIESTELNLFQSVCSCSRFVLFIVLLHMPGRAACRQHKDINRNGINNDAVKGRQRFHKCTANVPFVRTHFEELVIKCYHRNDTSAQECRVNEQHLKMNAVKTLELLQHVSFSNYAPWS